MHRLLIAISVFLLGFFGTSFYFWLTTDPDVRPALPSPRPYSTPVRPVAASPASAATVSKPPVPSGDALPAEVNLAIPFTSQAPHKNWDLPYKEFCEEASVLMVASYIRGETIASPDDADTKLRGIFSFASNVLGYGVDTNAEETAEILKQFYKITNVEVVYDPTVDQLKRAVAAGKAVIVPAAGRQLGNPFFRSPGPLYHMVVVKGYTKDGKFITNDPGTRRGAEYLYDMDVLMRAMHDWNNGNVDEGRKVVIIVG